MCQKTEECHIGWFFFTHRTVKNRSRTEQNKSIRTAKNTEFLKKHPDTVSTFKNLKLPQFLYTTRFSVHSVFFSISILSISSLCSASTQSGHIGNKTRRKKSSRIIKGDSFFPFLSSIRPTTKIHFQNKWKWRECTPAMRSWVSNTYTHANPKTQKTQNCRWFW